MDSLFSMFEIISAVVVFAILYIVTWGVASEMWQEFAYYRRLRKYRFQALGKRGKRMGFLERNWIRFGLWLRVRRELYLYRRSGYNGAYFSAVDTYKKFLEQEYK
jgi:hypothetical protein